MTFYVENETKRKLSFDIQETFEAVALETLAMEACPYEVQVELLLTDKEGIRAYNREYRGIDKETDVLSFPNIAYGEAGDFSVAEQNEADSFDPDSGELLLGNIVISVEKAETQAEEYGHSVRREYAFLIAHSMFHLCGYDHMTEAEAAAMEQKQEAVLQRLGITREEQ